ncbi:hypothetical protein CHS0354_022932 [Potamilus streckersoni]|uniref:Uncharacterized protein n=1 Tax=Potamilus streckersoni TaxID=2493646 RepID=A0AAE0VPK5_9BIVA|nr:hypothetical protein CHS0354_022932 [Potamilus streckersoni]
MFFPKAVFEFELFLFLLLQSLGLKVCVHLYPWVLVKRQRPLDLCDTQHKPCVQIEVEVMKNEDTLNRLTRASLYDIELAEVRRYKEFPWRGGVGGVEKQGSHSNFHICDKRYTSTDPFQNRKRYVSIDLLQNRKRYASIDLYKDSLLQVKKRYASINQLQEEACIDRYVTRQKTKYVSIDLLQVKKMSASIDMYQRRRCRQR